MVESIGAESDMYVDSSQARTVQRATSTLSLFFFPGFRLACIALLVGSRRGLFASEIMVIYFWFLGVVLDKGKTGKGRWRGRFFLFSFFCFKD